VSTPVASRPGIRVITRENVHQQGELFDMPPRMQARVNLAERWRTTGNRFGDLSASAATAYRNKLMKGEVADWADLCEFWITSDLDLASLYSTRMDRIMDREWEVLPNEFGDPRLAQLAAEMCHELIARIENWNQALRAFAHAIAVGFSAGERQWEYDKATKLFYVKTVHHRHGHRFRYGPYWDLRLYDKGQLQGADGYGDMLDRRSFIVHTHQEVAGYPNVSGVMLACTYTNTFARWVEKMRIGAVERYGQPVAVYECPPDTPEATRQEALEKMQAMAADGCYVVEMPGKIVLVAPASGSGGSMHKETLDDYYKQRARLWLGTSDIADPGEHGTQGAVGGRIDATTDPKTVSDLKGLAQTLHLSLLDDFVMFNAKRLGAPAASIPVPKLKAWKDESDMQGAPGPTMPGQAQQAPGMMPNGQPAPRIPEIQLSRDHVPKAAASGEPRLPRVRRVVGQAARLSQTPSTSLEMQVARVMRGSSATPER
jgi:phage gp29-like protein